MNRDEIIDLALSLTERKAENILANTTLFSHVVRSFCGAGRFWWRKRTFSFNTVANTPQYDLTTPGLTSPDMSVLSVEEITTAWFVQTAQQLVPLSPIFDDWTIAEMIEGADTPGVPGVYTFDDTDYKTLRLNMPNGAYKVRLFAWMMPNPATDDPSTVVPLVPPWLHHGIVHGLEAYYWRVQYGVQDERYATAKAAYDEVVEQAKLRKSFTTNNKLQFISPENSVQSTGQNLTSF